MLRSFAQSTCAILILLKYSVNGAQFLNTNFLFLISTAPAKIVMVPSAILHAWQ